MHGLRRKAFSLIELSIVLVILGLLVGGILAGKSLIRASELRSLSTSLRQYHTTIYSFRDKYMAYPGDLPNAASFWPTCASGTNNSCNGDGDGNIWRVGSGCANGDYSMESVRVWQHLALAGLIEGDYSIFNGKTCSGTYLTAIPGSTVPQLKIGAAGVLFYSSLSGSILNRKLFVTGEYYSDSLERAFLLPEEAWNIDIKLDDGGARTGRIWGTNGHTNLDQLNCYSSSVYSLTNTEKHCRILYFID